MVSQNFMNYSVGIGFLILVVFLSYATFSLSRTLNKFTSILTKADALAKDAEDFKNYIKQGILYLVSLFVKKGGDKNGKQKQNR